MAVAGLVLPRIIFEATKPGGGTAGVDMLIGLGLAAVIAPIALVAGSTKAGQAAEEIRAARPGAVVVRCLASQLYTGLFLKPGPATRYARDGGYMLLVADDEGIEIFGVRKKTWFGLVPWDRVRSISLDSARAPLRARPTLVVDIDARYTPYADQFELLLEGPDRAHPADALAEVTGRSSRHRPGQVEGTTDPVYVLRAPMAARRPHAASQTSPRPPGRRRKGDWVTLAALVSLALVAIVAAVAVASIPRPSSATEVRADNPREAQLRAEAESAGWVKYNEGLYFRWEPGRFECQSGWAGGCVTVQIESVAPIQCDAGRVGVSFLQAGNQVADSSQAFYGLDQGVPKEVGIRFDPALSNDTVRLDSISCGQ